MEQQKRLPAIAACVEGRVVADIGTDHAYLPIALCLENKIERAIASDIHKGPLERAKAHIAAHGLSDRIETRLGAGLSVFKPGEADCCVVAGMGGLMIVEMLANDMDTAQSFRRLMLQPQRDLPEVRRFLLANGFGIDREIMLKEEGKFYNILVVRPGAEPQAYSTAELYFGRQLLAEKDVCLREWLAWERERVRTILAGLEGRETARKAELLACAAVCEEAWEWLR